MERPQSTEENHLLESHLIIGSHHLAIRLGRTTGTSDDERSTPSSPETAGEQASQVEVEQALEDIDE